MKFLLQTIQGEMSFDFVFAVLDSIRHLNSNGEGIEYEYSDTPSIPECIPVGSVEFVTEYIRSFYGFEVRPRNVPVELFPFAGRKIFNGIHTDIKPEHFIKSNYIIKKFSGSLAEAMKVIEPGNYQISEFISFDTEWRAFIHRGNVIGLQNYLGSYMVIPDIERIRKMISTLRDAPIAYTLDVGIKTETKETVIIEMHDFFSCGLYGFNDPFRYPYMLSQWFHEFIRNNLRRTDGYD